MEFRDQSGLWTSGVRSEASRDSENLNDPSPQLQMMSVGASTRNCKLSIGIQG
ncbi:unnamed protein product, partial [Coccothraustes coccothraustes]